MESNKHIDGVTERYVVTLEQRDYGVVVMVRLLSVPIRDDRRSVKRQQRRRYLETPKQTDARRRTYCTLFVVLVILMFFVELCVEPR